MMPGRSPETGPAGGPARHVPVLLHSVLAALQPRDGGLYVDGTFGAGGYSRAILDAADCRLCAIDRDPEAVEAGRAMEAEYGGRLVLKGGRFSMLDAIAAEAGMAPADGVVLDIGVSSMQIDQAERGFSFRADGPLDMRMGREGDSAADLVNALSERDLGLIIGTLGEERRARAIARAIARSRAEAPIRTTRDLVRVVESVLGPKRDGRIHPATRTFQALRIHVNGELDELAGALGAAERLLKAGGRLVVVSFHSLEDRIVKSFLNERSGRLPRGSRHMPETGAPEPTFELIGRKPVEPDAAEAETNPRARSARMRAAIRTQAAARDIDPAAIGVPRIVPAGGERGR